MVATETLNLSFQDEAGRAYQLTVEKETSVYALTYDRQARVASPGRHGRGLAQGHRKRGTQDLRHLQRALQDMDLTVAGFQKLLHRFLKATDPRYADHYRGSDPVEARTRAVESDHAEFLAVNQTVRVTLSMPEEVPSDYGLSRPPPADCATSPSACSPEAIDRRTRPRWRGAWSRDTRKPSARSGGPFRRYRARPSTWPRSSWRSGDPRTERVSRRRSPRSTWSPEGVQLVPIWLIAER